MSYEGYNGQLAVTDDELILTRDGMVAKLGGIAGPPRHIPRAALSSVGWIDANPALNGLLTLGLGGAEVAQLSRSAATNNPGTIMFRRRDQDKFLQLHQLLLSIIKQNQAHGVDPSTVAYDAAGPTRLEQFQVNSAARAEEAATASVTRAQTTATQLVGEDRSDIVAAVARMGSRFGGKRELKKLVEHLLPHESVRFIAQGTYGGDQGIVALTDRRMLFLFHGVVRQRKEDFPLKLVSSVRTKSGMVTGELRVFASGNTAVITGIVKGDLEPLADALREGMATQHGATSPTPPPTQPADDPMQQLAQLAQLHQAGVLTEEEFLAKKEELLKRI